MSLFTSPARRDLADFPEYVLEANQLQNSQNFGLYKAASLGDIRNVIFELANGGKPNFFNGNEEQKTSLHIAAENGHSDVVKLLLEKGAMINCILPASKATALILAVEKGHTSVVRELLEYVPNIDLDHKNGYGNTALHESARGEHLEITQLLLSSGADIKTENNKGSSPLHFLCYGLTTNKASSERSLLHAKALLAAGSDVNGRDHRGATPLLVCCVSGREDLINFLLSCGGDIAAKDDKGQNAYDIALFHGQEKLLNLLRK